MAGSFNCDFAAKKVVFSASSGSSLSSWLLYGANSSFSIALTYLGSTPFCIGTTSFISVYSGESSMEVSSVPPFLKSDEFYFETSRKADGRFNLAALTIDYDWKLIAPPTVTGLMVFED